MRLGFCQIVLGVLEQYRSKKEVPPNLIAEAPDPALLFLPFGLESMDQSEVRKVFSRFDTNGDGKISATELTDILQALGSDAHPDEVQNMMNEMDTDHDGFVDFDEFVAFHLSGHDQSSDEAELREAFAMYDLDKNGVISAKELHQVLRRLGERCSVGDCDKMIRSVDVDGDGCVSFEEFKKMMGVADKSGLSK